MYIHALTKAELSAFIKSTISEAVKEVKTEISSMFPKENNSYLTIAEVAALFKIKKATVHNWIKRGTIKKYKINGRTLFKAQEIQDLFKNKNNKHGV